MKFPQIDVKEALKAAWTKHWKAYPSKIQGLFITNYMTSLATSTVKIFLPIGYVFPTIHESPCEWTIKRLEKNNG